MSTLRVSKERDVFDPNSVSFEERAKQIEIEQRTEAEIRKRE